MNKLICQRVKSKSINGIVGVFIDQHQRNIIAKFPSPEKKYATDLLQQDAIMMKSILDTDKISFEEKQHFITFHDSTPMIQFEMRNLVMLDGVIDSELFSSPCRPEYSVPCLVFYGITKAMSLETCLRDASVSEFETYLKHLEPFLDSCIVLAEKTGFSHGDLHASNVLWDVQRKRFVLIDYGRSFLYPEYVSKQIEKWPRLFETLDSYKEESHIYQPYKLREDTYYMLSPFTKTFSKPYKNTVASNRFMMLMDIAGLSAWMLYKHKNRVLNVYPDLLGVLVIHLKFHREKPIGISYVDLNIERMSRLKSKIRLSWYEIGILMFAEVLVLNESYVNLSCRVDSGILTFDFDQLVSKEVVFRDTLQLTPFICRKVHRRLYHRGP